MFLRMPHALGERYSPLYFLAALGAGGMTANFFVWLLFWVPHPDRAVPVFEDLAVAYANGTQSLRIAIVVAGGGILLFALWHLRLLVWNLLEFRRFRRTAAAQMLRTGNAETQLLALPLTIAMTINVGFILGMVCVPGLWSVVEYLFPIALAAFLAVGVWALSLLGDFYGRVLTRGGFECARNNSFAQMLPAFALAMVGVGLAAPAAMSATPTVAGLSYLLSSFFVVTALLLAVPKMMLGLRSMMETGANVETAPTLWIGVPILTVLTIAFLRQEHGLHVHLGGHGTAADRFGLLTFMLSAQIGFLLLGWVVLRRHRYFQRFVTGSELSSGSWVLICPGVALGVMLHFFVNQGLVKVGMIEKFDTAYWVLSGLALLIQVATVGLMLRVAQRHFGAGTRRATAQGQQGSACFEDNRCALANAAPGWPAPLHSLVAWDSVRLSVPDGQTLFGPGDPCRGFIVVLRGSIRVEHRDADRQPITLYRVGCGESCVVTTACLMTEGIYHTAGIAESDVNAIVLPPEAFRRLMAESDAFRDLAVGLFATRVNGLVDGISALHRQLAVQPPAPVDAGA